MKLLVFTSLFPNAVEPHHGVFVANRLALWRERHGGQAEVVAPVPLAPPLGPNRWTRYRAIPDKEVHRGITVHHPRYLSPPGFGDGWRASLMAAGVRSRLLSVAESFQPDVFDVHYAYPDGAAAAMLRPRLSQALGRRLPMVITCRGTDLNLLPNIPAVRRRIVTALNEADHVICVAQALADVAVDLGVPREQVSALRNGVDTRAFSPGDRALARQHTGLPEAGTVLLCVGHLIERKGQHLLLAAYAQVHPHSGPTLVFVGGGEERENLEALAGTLGVADRVRFVGAVPPTDLTQWYRAADVMILASLREGWPNVVLEALACGTPVLATKIWGTPEILNGCPAGKLVPATVQGLASGLEQINDLDPSAARPWAERHTWDATVDRMESLFAEVSSP
ncbi:MAG: teichuronic acid biosynthesis glycosyltransferase TuaC [Pseudohongiellaceae bacterium]|jgi:teichuronic acid biosynthesis glycosyltransferase TuaC